MLFPSMVHLFLFCKFAQKIREWLSSITQHAFIFNFLDIWDVCKKNWSKQREMVITSAIANIFSLIWFCRNQIKFQNKSTHWRMAISQVIAQVQLSGNCTKATSSYSIKYFLVLKAFKVSSHPSKATRLIEIVWKSPRLC